MKEGEIGEACSKHGTVWEFIQNLSGGNSKRNGPMGRAHWKKSRRRLDNIKRGLREIV